MKNLTLIATVLFLLASGYTQASAQLFGVPNRQELQQRAQKMQTEQLQKFFNAIDRGDAEAVSKMLNNGVSPNAKLSTETHTPLTLAAMKGDVDIVNLLIKKGANVNAPSKDHGQTALIYAAQALDQKKQAEYLTIVRTLVFNNAGLETADARGTTPLIAASNAYHDNTAIIGFLLRQKANVKARNKNGDTPLLRACYFGDPKTLKTLLKYGADINAQNNDKATPLIIATVNGRVGAVEFLLKNGANPNLTTADGMTALQYAEGSKPNKQIADLLREHGAK